jgi:hypothetical protein
VIIFGKWPLWIAIAVLAFVIAAALTAAGNVVIAAGLMIAVVIGGYYSWRSDTNY